MSRSITDARQVTIRSYLDQIALLSAYSGTADSKPANQSELDNLLASISSQLTPLLRMSAASTPSLVVSVGGGDITDSETNRRRAIPHVGTAYVQFSSGTITFPAASGGNIVSSPGTSTVLTCASGNYCAVLVYIDGNGQLNTITGTDSAVLATAITNLPPSPDETLPLGFVVVQNVAGTIQNITQSNIAQFGTGAGGGGSGNVTSTEAALRDYNNFAQTKYLDPNIFKTQKATKVDGSSTGSFDLVKNAFKFASIGQTFVSTNLANAEFLAEGVDITDLHLYNHWLLGFIDTAATYEASRDGGTNWSTITMTRVGSASNAYRGYLQFADESVLQSVATVAATGAGSALNATTQQQLSSKLILSSTTVIRNIDLLLNYGGAGTGTFKVQIIKDSAGSPSTALADLVSESNLQTISVANLGTGNITKNVTIPQVTLVAGTYHIVLSTDAAYKAGTLDLSWRSGAGTNGANYNGTSWTAGQASKAYTAKGRVHDLRIRITAGTATTYLEGMGVYFPSDDGLTQPNGTKNVQRFYFTGDENKTQFQLNWTPDPDILEMFDVYRGQTYVVDNDTVRISGQTVIFEPDTFNFPGESILIIARQIKGVGIDNSDSNAANISAHATNLLDVGNEIAELEFVELPKISVPNTTITKRAQIPDLSQDLSCNMGLNRILTQQIYRINDEFGPNGELVYGVLNDKFDQIRLVGNWLQFSDLSGAYINNATAGLYVEFTFYGTGCNVVSFVNNADTNVTVSVDGGAESADLYTTGTTGSSVLANRGYASNQIVKVVSGLSLGIHTVKLTSQAATNWTLYGFEVINNSSTVKVNPGSQYVKGKKLTLASQQSLAYNSTFETGTLGTRGGRVAVYQKSDGTIAKAVTPTDSSQGNINSASHANEEISRIYFPREFGAFRADDFSTLLNTGSNRSFSLDDDTAALVAQSGRLTEGTLFGSDVFANSGTGNFISIQFVGTGLDILFGNGNGTTVNYNITCDGASIGSLAPGANTVAYTQKIVSGLPYGTHVVKFTNPNAGLNGPDIYAFKVYRPKTPTVPTGAKLLSTYNIMADFAANGTGGSENLATGILRKGVTREFIYNGTWTLTQNSNEIGGHNIVSTTTGDYVEYTFWGTGLDVRFGATTATASWQFAIDGVTNLSGAGYTTSSYGVGVTSFTASTGTLVSSGTNSNGNGVRISGIPLGLHTIRITKTAGAGNVFFSAMDIITPIHDQRANGPIVIGNTMNIGSQGIGDKRSLRSADIVDVQKFSKVQGMTSGPTTTSTTLVPATDMMVPIYLERASRVKISAMISSDNSNGTSSANDFAIYVDGIQLQDTWRTFSGTGGVRPTQTLNDSVVLSAGFHLIFLMWKVSSGTGTLDAKERVLNVEVQEMD